FEPLSATWWCGGSAVSGRIDFGPARHVGSCVRATVGSSATIRVVVAEPSGLAPIANGRHRGVRRNRSLGAPPARFRTDACSRLKRHLAEYGLVCAVPTEQSKLGITHRSLHRPKWAYRTRARATWHPRQRVIRSAVARTQPKIGPKSLRKFSGMAAPCGGD